MIIYVQYADSTKAKITAYFAAPQDAEAYPNQGETDTSDPLWKSYYDGFPASMQANLPAPMAS
ncbi:hypothetical protein HNQ50_000322 [Silvimonas terrae]|uniref:Uncharacterized protein n=1 Tax=Silvimonas terrae TaxID=300266 RepID=A0A840RB98_9NEIS|nr:hypothetical protein [Silvimonas terrae]MBB5189612.1 hypothetical protein [Silvimonas terrae]